MTDDIELAISKAGQQAREAANEIAAADTGQKNTALASIAQRIEQASDEIMQSNANDLALARENQISVGTIGEQKLQPSGLQIGKMRVPLGVIGIIYESRPNVTADAAGLCIKSGNAAILRGGSEAIESNKAIAACIRAGLVDAGLNADVVQLIATTDRAAVGHLIQANDTVDVIVPISLRNLRGDGNLACRGINCDRFFEKH